MRRDTADLAVIGAGIVGLAHALAAARRGLRVVVVERDAEPAGASVRNFGFVTLTGQDDGDTRRRALRSREVWEEAAREAAIPILQRGSAFVARRPEALAILEEYAASAMGEGCRLAAGDEARARLPGLASAPAGALFSPFELRVEAREAMPRLKRWLAARHGVRFVEANAAVAPDGTRVTHAGGEIEARAVVAAPGIALGELAPEPARRLNHRVCTLQMLRLADPGWRLPEVVMTDLSLLRYGGMSSMPSAARLRARLERESAREIAAGVHLIVAQSADGTLVVGDTHRYDALPHPFAREDWDALVLGEAATLFGERLPPVVERWLGHYPVADARPLLREAPAPRVRLVSVSNGLGMSTAFAIGEETVAELFDDIAGNASLAPRSPG